MHRAPNAVPGWTGHPWPSQLCVTRAGARASNAASTHISKALAPQPRVAELILPALAHVLKVVDCPVGRQRGWGAGGWVRQEGGCTRALSPETGTGGAPWQQSTKQGERHSREG